LLTSYPVADVVTSNFFDSYRKGIRELNLPIDCHVVELNATHKGNEDRVESTFARLEKSLNQGLYSIVVTLNHEAANVIMRNYDRFPRTLPVLFAGLGRMPVDLKRQYPNSTGIGITDDTLGTVELGLKLFPEAQNLALVTDETTISEETRNEILSNCKLHFPQLDYTWINSLMPKQEIQSTLATLSPESLILFYPTHDYSNGHNETVTAFVRNIGFDERFPCLVLDDTLFGNGAVAGCVIETDKLGREAARMTAQILNANSAQRIPLKDIAPVKTADYTKFNSYRNFSGRIPLGTTVINKPDTMWSRHWETFVMVFLVILIVAVLQIFYLNWMRRRLRTSRNMLYSLPGRVLVLNRAETILFASWIKENHREKAPKKLEQLIGIDYPKLSHAIHEVFQSGKQITIEYNYEDVHRAISFALLEHDIFGQDAVICFSLDNTELQQARRQAERYSAQLKKSTRMWDILINFLPIHIFAKDIDNDFRYVFNNRTRCMFYGVGENELNDKTDFDFLPRDVAERRRKEDEEFVNNSEEQMEANVDVRSWDGKLQHIRTLQRVFTDEDGTRLLLGTSINITELEEAHLQLQQLNSQLQELLQQHSILLDNMPSFVMTKDVDDGFRIITCNDAWLKFLGQSVQSVAGKTDHEVLFSDEDADAIRAEDLHAVEVLERRPEYHSTGRLRDRNGRIRIGNFYRKLIRTSDNRRILFTLFHDVTELENAKREAEENADRFLLTLRSIGDGIITTDADGVVTLINPNAETLLGCKQADVLGKPHTDFFRIVHEQTGKTVVSPLAEALRSGEVANGADLTDLVSVSGQRYHIASNAAPIRTRSGEVTGAILVFRDVTDERNKREELRRAMTSLENASNMARLASFRFEIKTHKRSGSSLLYSIWPNDENGEPIRFEDWVYPDDIPLFARELERMEQSNKQGETATFSFRIGQTSSLRYIRALVSLDLSVPDEPAVAGILQDVTELTLSMMKLRETQSLWDAAINAIPVMFTVKDVDHDFRYLLCNNAFANIFKRTPNEIIGRTDAEVFEDKAILDFAGRMNNPVQTLNTTMDFEEELPVGGKQKHLRFIKTVTRVIQDASGRKLLLAASNDVTDMQKLLTIERINTEMLSRFNREQDFDSVLDGIAGILRKELGCARIVVVHKDKSGFVIYRQWQYDGLTAIGAGRANPILGMLGWEKRVRQSALGSIIRIDGLQGVVDAGDLKLDEGANTREFSIISVPVYEKNQLTGGIFLTFLQDRRDFTSLDEAILISCGNIVSLARQRERNQQAIRQVMLENQLILDNIDIPIWLFNTDNVLLRTNTAVSRVAGRPGETFSPDENERIFRDFSAKLADPDVSIDALVRRSSRLQGTTYLGQDYIVVNDGVRDNQGNLLYNMVYAVNVTTMNQLIQNQKFGNELLEEVISEDDFDTCIRRTLENVCRLLGASRGCLLEHVEDGTKTRCIAEYIDPDNPHAAIKMYDRTLGRVRGILENTDDKRTFVCSDVQTINWSRIVPEWGQAAQAIDLRSIFLSNILLDGKIWGTLGFNYEGVVHKFTDNDVSILRSMAHMIELVLSRKRAKALIMDALARAQAADKAKSFFIASVSHEIRTPLNSVIGFAELLREGGVSQKQEKEYLDAISSSANALLMLINDVLDLSKLEANQMQ
ncbi:MAG: PAS domain-containing protein, partial [Lentisphaeria bacterium]|nr:PAS domain-containing protein [Lentisphaeria bacterium]